MTPRTLPREPWRGSMICGWQVAFGDWTHGPAWCAERKGEELPYCEEHLVQALEEYGHVSMADGVALGGSQWAVRLLWEGDDPAMLEEASAEEMALYAPILDLPRSV